jgi:hypothetical protein
MRVSPELPIAEPDDHCASGGIGRRTGFRFQRRKAWRFDPSLAHEDVTARESETAPGSRAGVGPGGDVSGDDSSRIGVRLAVVRGLVATLRMAVDVSDMPTSRALLDALEKILRSTD